MSVWHSALECTLSRTSWALGGATVTSSMRRSLTPRATAALHVIGLPAKADMARATQQPQRDEARERAERAVERASIVRVAGCSVLGRSFIMKSPFFFTDALAFGEECAKQLLNWEEGVEVPAVPDVVFNKGGLVYKVLRSCMPLKDQSARRARRAVR